MTTKVTKQAVREAAQTKLEKAVAKWIAHKMDDYPDTGAEGVLKDLFYGGCSSGIVGGLVYYADTERFYRKHAGDIWGLAIAQADEQGLKSPFALLATCNHGEPEDYAQVANFLAWYGFEEAARVLASRLGIDS